MNTLLRLYIQCILIVAMGILKLFLKMAHTTELRIFKFLGYFQRHTLEILNFVSHHREQKATMLWKKNAQIKLNALLSASLPICSHCTEASTSATEVSSK